MAKAGNSMADWIAIVAMRTSSSINVNALDVYFFECKLAYIGTYLDY